MKTYCAKAAQAGTKQVMGAPLRKSSSLAAIVAGT